MTPKVTMDEIAERLGISKAAVSLALRNQPGVSESTRQAVVEMAERVGYVPRGVRITTRAAGQSVFVLCPDKQGGRGISGIQLDYVDGIQAAASDFNLRVLIESLTAGRFGKLSWQILKTRPERVLGMLLIGMEGQNDPVLDLVRQLDLPLVVVNRYWPESDLSFVSIDYRHAEASLVEYLSRLGHRKIAFVGLDSLAGYGWYQQRKEGYEQGLLSLGGGPDPRLIIQAGDIASAVESLLHSAPDATAVCAADDEVAVGLIGELKRLNIRVPDDVSVAGFDADSSDPSLTSVKYDAFGIGYRAVGILVERQRDSDLWRTQMVVRSSILERDSCGPPRGRATLTGGR